MFQKMRVLFALVLVVAVAGSCSIKEKIKEDPKVYRPAYVEEEKTYGDCKLASKKLKLQYAPSFSARDKIAQCTSAACVFTNSAIAFIVVPAGSYLASGSVVVAGNTLHWIEAQGRCDESTTNSFFSSVYGGIKSAGGTVLSTSSDAVDWISGKEEDLPSKPADDADSQEK